ncbi:MAG: hypothetical protein LC659_04530, partial [Myxococcales bacterium]|nr:hypothetical protein [Myxococcales bacterium]
RTTLLQRTVGTTVPFFPFGNFVASVRPRSDGALVFEVFARDFPFHTTPLFAYEDLALAGSFGDVGRLWFGGVAGVKPYGRADLDADGQAAVMHAVEALRRDAVAFFGERAAAAKPATTRQEFDLAARAERSLQRTVATRRDLAASLAELSDRLAPRPPDGALAESELFVPIAPPSLATTLAHDPSGIKR